MNTHWQVSRFDIDLRQPKVMGIVNVTPDSFSDGGRFDSLSAVMAHAERLVAEGADILDIGGESTRPGSPAISLDEELARVLPVVKAAVPLQVPVSVDTSKPEVMRAVLDVGADIINDVWALRQTGAREIIAAHSRCGVCLMHMHQTPQTMHLDHMRGEVLGQVRDFLLDQTMGLIHLGVSRERLMLDYGIGFGKSVEQNFALLAKQHDLLELDFPLLAGWSRKGSLGAITGLAVQERMVPSVVAAVLAVNRGASVVRVHDVAETVAALKVWSAMHAHEQSWANQ